MAELLGAAVLELADPLGLTDPLELTGALELDAGVLELDAGVLVTVADGLVETVLETEVVGGGLLLWVAVVLDPLHPLRISRSTITMIRMINAHSHQGNLRRRRSSPSGGLGTIGCFGSSGTELPPLLYDTLAPRCVHYEDAPDNPFPGRRSSLARLTMPEPNSANKTSGEANMQRLRDSPGVVSVAFIVPFALFLTGIGLTAIGLDRIGGTATGPNRGAVPPATWPASRVVVQPSSAGTSGHQPAALATSRPQPPAVPVRIQVPSLGIDAPVIGVSIQPDGGLAVPNSPQVLGWWRSGAAPGTGRGTVVIDGHVDTARDGPGALYQLADLRPGQLIWLRTSDGRIGYTVRAIRSYQKAKLPANVFDPLGNPRLVLITCGGSFNRSTRQYSNNIVAYATPVG
ncbi:MAG: class F sortase [Jatrophihabitantaceae bacterium]